jgi:N-acetylglucosaminyldiphosphoundecaprenol N-acetyl-beta-D-mannosaminyltransferase
MRIFSDQDSPTMDIGFESQAPQRIRLLGGEVDLVTPSEVLAYVGRCVERRKTAVIANHNFHSLYLCRKSPDLRAFFEKADLIEADSTPMIAWGRALGMPIGIEHRSTYLDWRSDFWRLADANHWRVFYLGGAPGIASAACERLAKEWPNATLASRNGYFDDRPGGVDNEAVLAEIAAFDPHIIFVGMGMPRQEQWILRNMHRLSGSVLFSVGAAYDYEAGAQIAAPRWMGRVGLEWLFRLVTQPRRLGYRYLVEPLYLLPAAIDDLARRFQGPSGPGLRTQRRGA